jgi:chemotaxis response regulator CheB
VGGCGEATNGEDAVREVARLLPDVILLDLSIPYFMVLELPRSSKRLSCFGGNTDE